MPGSCLSALDSNKKTLRLPEEASGWVHVYNAVPDLRPPLGRQAKQQGEAELDRLHDAVGHDTSAAGSGQGGGFSADRCKSSPGRRPGRGLRRPELQEVPMVVRFGQARRCLHRSRGPELPFLTSPDAADGLAR